MLNQIEESLERHDVIVFASVKEESFGYEVVLEMKNPRFDYEGMTDWEDVDLLTVVFHIEYNGTLTSSHSIDQDLDEFALMIAVWHSFAAQGIKVNTEI